MPDHDLPPGWSHNPSCFRRRWPALVVALAACGVATYLTLYQVDVLAHVWEPFFGNGSKRVLKESIIARYCPIPDASLGAFAYLVEAVIDSIGGADRWRRRPWIVVLLGLMAAGMVCASTGLVLVQAFVVHAFCTLCLVSAGCSYLVALGVLEEVLATVQHLRRASAQGHSLRQALWGVDQPAAAGGGQGFQSPGLTGPAHGG